MLFSSISFLYYFLPAVLLVYFVAPSKLKNLVLLVASLFFYFFGEPIYCFLMIFSIASAYLHGLWISNLRGSNRAKIPFISSIVVSVGVLAFFKYHAFFVENVNTAFNLDITVLSIALPIGISFYTFQILSYTIDLYLGKVQVQRNLINFATYVALFPQLIAGPIVRYITIEASLTGRKHTIESTAYGIKRFITGLAKKVIIANSLGELVAIFSNSNEASILFYWMAALAFMLQIYFDFSGYSDMAIGLGRIFGFHFLENFNYPYIAKNVTEFWRRWHISLGTWFRDYVYIPMGGNRVPWLKWARNILIVWFLTGFWHGAAWNFIVWGLYFAVFLVLEKYLLKNILAKLPFIIGHLYLIFVVLISFVVFNADSLGEGIHNLKGMFGMVSVPFVTSETIYYLKSYGFIFVLAAFLATPLPNYIAAKLSRFRFGENVVQTAQPVALVALLFLVTGYLIDGSFNPFIYFRF